MDHARSRSHERTGIPHGGIAVRRVIFKQLFATGLVGISIFANGLTVLILRDDYPAVVLAALYSGQAIVLVGLRQLTLGRDPDSDIVGW
jgi:hypothetical protein